MVPTQRQCQQLSRHADVSHAKCRLPADSCESWLECCDIISACRHLRSNDCVLMVQCHNVDGIRWGTTQRRGNQRRTVVTNIYKRHTQYHRERERERERERTE